MHPWFAPQTRPQERPQAVEGFRVVFARGCDETSFSDNVCEFPWMLRPTASALLRSSRQPPNGTRLRHSQALIRDTWGLHVGLHVPRPADSRSSGAHAAVHPAGGPSRVWPSAASVDAWFARIFGISGPRRTLEQGFFTVPCRWLIVRNRESQNNEENVPAASDVSR